MNNESNGRVMPVLAKTYQYLFELFVVFLGVYLAFIFTDYQEEIEEYKTRIKYYDSLVFEFKKFGEHLEAENIKIEKHVKIIEKIAKGEKPTLVPSDFYYLYKGAVVNAAFNDKNFESLDKDTLHSIIGGIPLLQLLEKKITRIEQLNQVVLYPMLMGLDSIYYKNGGGLVSSLQWYPKLVKDIQQANRTLHAIVTKNAIPGLEKQKQQMIARSFSFL
jgi:hypothetical protein